jgi:hypothetical protein
MVERIKGLVGPLKHLVGDSAILWPASGPIEPGAIGRAWCPTPWALNLMRRAGVHVPAAPSLEVLRAVNHRAFAHRLGQHLPHTTYVTSVVELEAVLKQPIDQTSASKTWLLKRPLGFAGRGRRKVGLPLSTVDRSWVEASLKVDGLLAEPYVAREVDLALHGFLPEEGGLTLGSVTIQHVDSTGAWRGTRCAEEGTLSGQEKLLLYETAEHTASALRSTGYHGPFGIDAFVWRSPTSVRCFQPRCELNARYSMGWAIGMGSMD